MYIEDVEKEFPKEMHELDISVQRLYNLNEVLEIHNRCKSLRERKELSARLDKMQEQFELMQEQLVKIQKLIFTVW